MSSNTRYVIQNVNQLTIPFTGGCTMDLAGNVYPRYSNQPLLPTFETGSPRVRLVFDNKEDDYPLEWLMAITFMPMHCEHELWKQFEVGFINNKKDDINPHNLYWKQKDGPVESIRLPGWFIIPGYTQYLINKEGEVLDVRKAKVREPFSSGGYPSLRMNRDFARDTVVGIHRLLALAFVPYDSYPEDLVINHIDGDKSNNALENIEWVTRANNAFHAILTRLVEGVPVLVRNVRTNEVTEFPSVTSMARFYQIDKKTAQWRVGKDDQRVYYPGVQYQLKDKLTEWRKPTQEEIEKSKVKRDSSKKTIICKNLETGEEVYTLGTKEAAKVMNISDRTLGADLKGYIDHKPRNGWDFWYASKPSESV